MSRPIIGGYFPTVALVCESVTSATSRFATRIVVDPVVGKARVGQWLQDAYLFMGQKIMDRGRSYGAVVK